MHDKNDKASLSQSGPVTRFAKIKKNLPIIATAGLALGIIFLTGGAGLVIFGVALAGVGYLQNASAFKNEFKKNNQAKLNRGLQFRHELISDKGKLLNEPEHFKIPEKANLDKKSYLLLGHPEKSNLYYIDSKGWARMVKLKDKQMFMKNIIQHRAGLNYPEKISPNATLNQVLQHHILADKVQQTRHKVKKLIAALGLATIIAGVVAAMPFVGLPLAASLTIAGLGLGLAVLMPSIGHMIKKVFTWNIANKKQTKPYQLESEEKIEEILQEHFDDKPTETVDETLLAKFSEQPKEAPTTVKACSKPIEDNDSSDNDELNEEEMPRS